MADPRDLLEPATLARRDDQSAALDFELSFQEAQLRGREALLTAQQQALAARAQQIDERERRLREAAHGRPLLGLEAGSAMIDLDLEGHARQAGQLHLGRAALVAAREEWLARRQQKLAARRLELDDVDQGLQRASDRLVVREQLLAGAALLAHSWLADSQHLENTERPGQVRGVADAVATAGFLPPREGAPPPAPPTAKPAEVPPAQPDAADGATSRMPSAMNIRAVPRLGAAPPTVAAPSIHDPRHAQTMTMEPEDGERLDEPVRPRHPAPLRRTRATPAPILPFVAAPRRSPSPRQPAAAPAESVPDDLPDAAPSRAVHRLQKTESFLARLTLDRHAVLRAQVRVDQGEKRLWVRLAEHEPKLALAPLLVFTAPDATEESFPVRLQGVVPTEQRPEGGQPGVVAELSTADWDAARHEAFTRVLERLL